MAGSRRDGGKPVAWLGAVAIVITVVPVAITAWPMRGPILTNIGDDAPAGATDAFKLAFNIQVAGVLLMFLLGIASAASVIIRFRRATGDEREQLKWFAYAGCVPRGGHHREQPAVQPVRRERPPEYRAVDGPRRGRHRDVQVPPLRHRRRDQQDRRRRRARGVRDRRVPRDRGRHRHGDRHERGAEPRAVHRGDGGRRTRVPASARAREAACRPRRLREARDAVRGAFRLLGAGGRRLLHRRRPAAHGSGARRGDGSDADRGVAAGRGPAAARRLVARGDGGPRRDARAP